MGYTPNFLHQMHHTPGYHGDLHGQNSIKLDYYQAQQQQVSPVPRGRNKYPNQGPQHGNSFNVGYNLRFQEGNKKFHLPPGGKKFENAEVIRGRLKNNEQVRAPGPNQEYGPQTFLQQKPSSSTRYTSSPTNQHYQTTRQPSFSYPTQQNIFIKPEQSQNDAPWKSIGIEEQQAIQPQNYFEKSFNNPQGFASFNHDVALKNSESFDFSNVHGQISYGDDRSGVEDNIPAGSEHHPQNIDLNNLNIEAHIPKNLRGVKPLPLDTSLLQDPVLTTSLKGNPDTAKLGGKVIPIHFDVSSVQAAVQKELGKSQTYSPFGQQNFDQYNLQQNVYDAQRANDVGGFNGDPYKIVSMRPPPVTPNFGYRQ